MEWADPSHSATGQYCDPIISSWRNELGFTTAQSCSECWLGTQAFQLGSPLGYDDGLASNFASLTSSCNATGYTFTSPTPYALNGTATILSTVAASATPTTSSICTSSYTIEDGDTCNTVAKANNVSTFALTYANDLDIYCTRFAAVGSTLCIPQQCKTYTLQGLDTCDSILANHTGVTRSKLLS